MCLYVCALCVVCEVCVCVLCLYVCALCVVCLCVWCVSIYIYIFCLVNITLDKFNTVVPYRQILIQ